MARMVNYLAQSVSHHQPAGRGRALKDEKNGPKTTEEVELGSQNAHFEVGAPVGEVKVDIDNAIIRHFSEHLYSSPNKAIEELVSNGFDALATLCYVYIPGEHVQGRVLVWDNGMSMDTEGLELLWLIARSPKEDGKGRVHEVDGRRRAMIGKFGIGKLASYAVGNRISHVCRTADGRYLTVSVDYRDFTDPEGDRERPRTPIRELTFQQAETLVRELLPRGAAVDVMLAENHWTLAVIDYLKDVPLYPRRLGWVLGNGMPLRPDFRIFVEDMQVTARLASKAAATWTLEEQRLRDSIATVWKDAAASGQVDGEPDLDPGLLKDDDRDKDDPTTAERAVAFPSLGRVTATVRIFTDSLAVKAEDEDRSYGFFLTVRGRLVNADDDKLFLNDPSYGTFYRSQFQIRADGLDEELLADRESLRRDTPMTRELAVLQTALYRAARAGVEQQDDIGQKEQRPESRLPTQSRELFRDPVASLLARAEAQVGQIDLDEPRIDRVELGEAARLAELNPTDGHFQVNRTHPFYRAVAAQAGTGQKAAMMLRAFDLFAVSERLTEGFLYGRGVPDDQVTDLFEWRDRLFRALGVHYGRNPEDVILELRASSIPGGKRFEIAISTLFNLMGYRATRDGASGKEDVLVVAPLGPGHRTFIVEAKGSKDAVGNVTAALAGAAAHRAAVGAAHAVVVAREFTGFDQKDEPAILKECQAVGAISVVTVETLVKLYRALVGYSYPLDIVMDALFEVETPTAKEWRVENLTRPLANFNFREVLDDVWARQEGESAADLVPTRTLWQSRSGWRHGMSIDDFEAKLAALDHLAGGLVVLDQKEKTIYLRSHPNHVADHVGRSLDARSTLHTSDVD